ncbi:conserved hypothetical protein [Gammaproteobacteria bacterium]
MNSIYNVTDYNVSTVYNKNDIINFTGTFNGMTIVGGYLYCITDGTTGAFDSTKWIGYISDNGDIKPYFTWTPSYQSTVNNTPKVRLLKFGDSYESRTPDGINNSLLSYELKFDLLEINEMTAILHFLTVRYGVKSFVWFGREPYIKQLRFVARDWNDVENFSNNYSLSVKFDQVVN